jgi:hypothetical protein
MKISWIFSENVKLDPMVDLARIKEIGPIWGSWTTWRACQTDNVICNDIKKATELIKRAFHSVCNFYIPSACYQTLDRPPAVKIYEGEFKHEVDNQEEIVAMHLAAMDSEIVLLLGFDFSARDPLADKLLEHRVRNYEGLTKQAMAANPQVQWVVIDHPGEFRKDLSELDNLTQDSLDNVIGMLSN